MPSARRGASAMTAAHTPSVAARLKTLLRAAPGGPLLRFVWHMRDPRGRNLALLEWERPPGLFQPEPLTALDRYPKLFRFVRDRIGDGEERCILSFGCSSGEEVFTLRRYFPAAHLKGIDINRRNIAACRRKLAEAGGDPRISFAAANSAEGEPLEHYDAIFAMAVFRHGGLGGAPPRCDRLIRFEDFERCITGLAARLRPGGLLILRHANFRFADTATAAVFRSVFPAPSTETSPIYGRDGQLVPGARGDGGIFEKCGAAGEL